MPHFGLFNVASLSAHPSLLLGGKALSTLLLSVTVLLTACGGGSGSQTPEDDGAVEPDPRLETASLSGGAVDGPLAGADVSIYKVDITSAGLANSFKGSLIGSGTTGDDAQISGLELNPEDIDVLYYVVEFSNGTDISTNTTPIIPTLRTIVTGNQLTINKTPIFATPLSTLAIDLAAVYMSADDSLSFQAALNQASFLVRNMYGLGYLGSTDIDSTDAVDLFTTPALLIGGLTDANDQEDMIKMRQAVETFTAIVNEIFQDTAVQSSGISTNELLIQLANDLADEVVDGTNGADASKTAELAAVTGLETLATTIPSEVAGRPGVPLTTSGIMMLLDEEESVTATDGTTVGSVTIPAPTPVLAGQDADGDGVIDRDDFCPEDDRGFEDPLDTGATDPCPGQTHVVRGGGSLTAIPPTSALVNSTYLNEGIGSLVGDVLTFQNTQETDNLLGFNYITSRGTLNIVTGEGSSTLISCLDANGDPGNPLVCADIDAAIGTPAGTTAFDIGGPVTDLGNGSFQWEQNDIITFTGAITGTGDSQITFILVACDDPTASPPTNCN